MDSFWESPVYSVSQKQRVECEWTTTGGNEGRDGGLAIGSGLEPVRDVGGVELVVVWGILEMGLSVLSGGWQFL
jgi:hypothetical protein